MPLTYRRKKGKPGMATSETSINRSCRDFPFRTIATTYCRKKSDY